VTRRIPAPDLIRGLPQTPEAPDQVRGGVSPTVNTTLTRPRNPLKSLTPKILSTVDIPMTRDRLFLFDTTLRDGQQTQGVQFSGPEKAQIAGALDALGVDYIEGGWPGANPTDSDFFAAPPADKSHPHRLRHDPPRGPLRRE
jgi:hypothetical protein